MTETDWARLVREGVVPGEPALRVAAEGAKRAVVLSFSLGERVVGRFLVACNRGASRRVFVRDDVLAGAHKEFN